MKNRAAAAMIIIATITAVIVGAVLNFPEFSMGSPATLRNLIVTILYLTIWIIVIRICTKNKNRGIVIYCSAFWFITLLLSILTVCVNATEVHAAWAIPFVILFLNQLYGIRFLAGSLLNTSIIIAFISLVIFFNTVISYQRIK